MPLEYTINYYRQIAKEIEKKARMPVSVIRQNEKSIVPWITTGDGITFYLITPKDYPLEKLQEIHNEYSMQGINIQQMHPIEEMVDMVKKNPSLIRHNLGGMGFIVPFFFHNEIYGKYSKRFRQRFNEEFKGLLQEEIDARIKRLELWTKKSKEQIALHNRKVHERQKKLVGPLEEKELTRTLASMAEYINKQNGEVLIVFDKSGRPLGSPLKKILREAHNRDVKIYFIDPDSAKNSQNQKNLLSALRKEQPQMVREICGKNIMLIDDQVWQGRSFEAITKLLRSFKPRTIESMPMSGYPADPQPSWRVHGMHRVEEPELAKRKFVSQGKFLTSQERKRLASLWANSKNTTKRVQDEFKGQVLTPLERRKLLALQYKMQRVAKNAILRTQNARNAVQKR